MEAALKKILASNFETFDEETIRKTCAEELTNVVHRNKAGQKKVYFAGPWFNVKSKTLHTTCKKIYQHLKNESVYDVFFPDDFHSPYPSEVFQEDCDEVKNCDILVAMIDGKDVGTAWEIGMAYALGKQIYLLGFDETSFIRKTNLMLAFTGECFTLNKWSKFLTVGLGHDDFVNTQKSWEELE